MNMLNDNTNEPEKARILRVSKAGYPLVTIMPGRVLRLAFLQAGGRYRVEEHPVAEWAARWSLPVDVVVRRLLDPKGCWPPSALKLPEKAEAAYTLERDGYEVDGKRLGFTELAQRLGIQRQTLRARLMAGWEVEAAVSVANVAMERWAPNRPSETALEQARQEGKALRVTGRYRPSEQPFEFRGKLGTLREHCEHWGYNYYTVLARTQDRKLKVKQRDGTVKEFFYPAMSREAALAAGRRKSGPARRTRSDKGKERPHLRVPFGPYREPEKELERYGEALGAGGKSDIDALD